MTDIDTRPELPDIFPQTNVTVSGEKHRYTVSQTNNGPEPKLDYLLDKAPVEVVQSIQGTDQDGTSRTFNNGVDYELTALDDTVSEQFEYEVEQEDYLLRYDPIQGSTTVTDSDPDEVQSGDSISITGGIQIPDDLAVADSTASNAVRFFDDVVSNDSVKVNENRTDAPTDELVADDSTSSTEQNVTVWDTTDWNQFNWAGPSER